MMQDNDTIIERSVLSGGSLETVQFNVTAFSRSLATLSATQLSALQNAIAQWSSDLLDTPTKLLYDEGVKYPGKAYQLICAQSTKSITVRHSAKPYTVGYRSGTRGTTTILKSGEDSTSYMWGDRTVDGKPDEVKITATTLCATMKVSDNGTVPIVDVPHKKNATLFPKGMSAIARTYVNGVASHTTVESVVSTLSAHTAIKAPVKKQICDDLQLICPKVVQGFGTRKVKGGYVCFKGIPTKVSIDLEKEGSPTFANYVDIVNSVSSGIGSAKEGFGRIRAYHYDGISDLEGAARERHEWLTDFVYTEAQVYLVRTRNRNIALALMRVIKNSSDKKFVVVFEARDSGNVKIDEYIKTTEAGHEVITTGAIGINSLSWKALFAGYTTYYINFKSPTRSQGSGGVLVANAYRDKEPEHEIASSFTNYMYYAHISAMGEKDKAYISSRGRDGRVIIHRKGPYTRVTAIPIVLNMVRHAAIYPFIHSPYIYQDKDNEYFYDGVRRPQVEYNFSPLEGTELELYLCSSEEMSDAVVIPSHNPDAEDAEEGEEEELEW